MKKFNKKAVNIICSFSIASCLFTSLNATVSAVGNNPEEYFHYGLQGSYITGIP